MKVQYFLYNKIYYDGIVKNTISNVIVRKNKNFIICLTLIDISGVDI